MIADTKIHLKLLSVSLKYILTLPVLYSESLLRFIACNSVVNVLFSLSDDALFTTLWSVLLARGKGRRPKLPEVELTNRLLIQLLFIKEEGGKSFDETATFLSQLLLEGVGAPLPRLHYMFVSAEQQADKLTTSEQRIDFLSQKFDLGLGSFGPYLQSLSRQQLLDGHVSAQRAPTFGLLKDLHSFKNCEQGATYKDMSEWWLHLTGILIQEKKLKTEIEKMQRKIAKLQPNAACHPKVRKELNDFLDSCVLSSGQSCSTAVPLSTLDAQVTRSSTSHETEMTLAPTSSKQLIEERQSLET